MLPILLLTVLLLAAALWLLRQGQRAQAASGLPAGEIVYSDTGAWQNVEQPLLSRRYGLVGKPDYLMADSKGGLIPIEVKSGRQPQTPHQGHLLQLGVYCLLVEDAYGQTPTHGLLHYADATLRIPFTEALRAEVLTAAAAMQRAHQARNLRRNHAEIARCRACGYRHACGKEATVDGQRVDGETVRR